MKVVKWPVSWRVCAPQLTALGSMTNAAQPLTWNERSAAGVGDGAGGRVLDRDRGDVLEKERHADGGARMRADGDPAERSTVDLREESGRGRRRRDVDLAGARERDGRRADAGEVLLRERNRVG